LCLDADVAGVAAIERLCGSNILRATVDSSQVDLLIAAFPEGIKDPAEFVERKRGENDQVGNEFRDTVISRAEEWTSWYVRRIISSGNSSDVRSFGQSFESVAEFLSTFPNPAERIRRASDVAFILTGIMAKQANASISTAVRIQLEADLIDMVSRKAAAKESLKRRIESVANSGNVSSTVTLSKFTDGLSADEEVGKLSSTVRSATRSGGDLSQTSNPKTKIARDVRERSNRRVFQAGNTRSKAKEEDHLTPHFSGFKFVNRADSDWLRLNEVSCLRYLSNELFIQFLPLGF
jgi:DNA primase